MAISSLPVHIFALEAQNPQTAPVLGGQNKQIHPGQRLWKLSQASETQFLHVNTRVWTVYAPGFHRSHELHNSFSPAGPPWSSLGTRDRASLDLVYAVYAMSNGIIVSRMMGKHAYSNEYPITVGKRVYLPTEDTIDAKTPLHQRKLHSVAFIENGC